MIEHEGFDLNIDSFRLNELPQTDTHDRHLSSDLSEILSLEFNFISLLSLGLSSKAHLGMELKRTEFGTSKWNCSIGYQWPQN